MAIQAQLYSDNSFGCPQDFLIETDPNPFFRYDHTTNEYDQNLYNHSTAFPHIESHQLDFEHLINFQNERLRYAIQEQSKHQISGFLRSYESRARFLVAQKDEEIATAATRTAELREFLRNLEIEGLTWQRIARENESMAASLTGTIQRMQSDHGDEEDAESCCPVVATVERRCRRCESREARVVLLPCQHLCSCGECEAFIEECPVCMTGKRGSIAVEAFAA